MTAEVNDLEFNYELDEFFKELEEEHIPVAVRKISIEMFKRIVQKNVVDTGRMRASWTLAEGAPNTKVQPKDKDSYPQDSTIENYAYRATTNLPEYPRLFINNSLDYAVYVEDKHHGVELSMAEIKHGT